LIGSESFNLLKEVYGGMLVQKIESKECTHTSQRDEGFFSIQCEVKGKKSLDESLRLYVEGEALDGENKYYCDTCKEHVSAMKRYQCVCFLNSRTCIKSLPNSLIIHLKRFDFDRDTMRRVKLNDQFEFPLNLDMAPYLETNLDLRKEGIGGESTPNVDSQHMYRLSGIHDFP
jgi:ubiquitin carboxyl-terminal hydrolase 34